ncbi:MAG: DEAD/DEAH box helicase [Gammaproteobacteria bacterium]
MEMRDDLITEVQFSDLDLDERLLRGVADAGFQFCTPIQARSLPLLLDGQDVAGQAQTGTGKTAAYLLATMNKLLDEGGGTVIDNRPAPAAIILAPTRELAIQIHKDAEVLGAHTDFRLALVYGGVDYDKQRDALSAGVDILIGTPGRIIDYFKQGVFSLKGIRALVLDEADRMFDLGFIKDLRFLLRRMTHPTERLNMLYSATLSHRVNELAYEHMDNPQPIEIAADKRTADKVEQVLYHASSDEKMRLLIGLFQHHDPSRTIVFVNTKRTVADVVAYLTGNGYNARALSGDVMQSKRQKLIEQFKSGAVDIVVATDVAARGLHIPDVSHVVNFDLPQNPEDYVHRIGRTARAGASGDAISIACEQYVFSLEGIEDYIGHKIPVAAVTDDLLAELKPPKGNDGRRQPDGPRRRSGGGGRRRGRRPATRTS